ncbi:hypothetical protein [Bacillus sp. B15-48]|uniref:hypothetical protein n=1 Tax=Bacillus sp. B15-48 TaxID=1548601 RepID=UPI00193ED00C|nr:hypothetical protein [Bacillus sp. B15-48]MBM4762916.1 hypothetical protein [Bacillus sp. B15-48]
MSANYQMVKKYVGKTVRFKNEEDQWVVGKIVNVDRNGIEVEEFERVTEEEGYGYPFFGARRFWGPRPFFPRARRFGRYPFGRFGAIGLLPFFFI